MRNPGTIRFFLFLMSGYLAVPAAAETVQERVALSWSGPDCAARYPAIEAVLTGISGVTRVDSTSVPDHMLVDLLRGSVAPEELPATARRALSEGLYCEVDIMKSCISAGPPPPRQ